jgi:hypothetical protein
MNQSRFNDSDVMDYMRRRMAIDQVHSNMINGMTIGIVTDNDDPMQSGRLKVFCPNVDADVSQSDDLPWCNYVSPLGGITEDLNVGPKGITRKGKYGYGFWAIPKINSSVIVFFLNGDPSARYWMGCVYEPLAPKSMPHSRTSNDGVENAIKARFLQLAGLSTDAIRGADERSLCSPDPAGGTASGQNGYGPSMGGQGNSAETTDPAGASSQTQDQTQDTTKTSGTTASPVNADTPVVNTDGGTDGDTSSQTAAPSEAVPSNIGLDPQSYTLVTPGGHYLLLSDNSDTCRIRLKTTNGHQILLDDTNDTVYISCAKGNSWIEMDKHGNLYAYTANTFSVGAGKGVNIATNGDLNLTAGGSINLGAGGSISATAGGDMNLCGAGSLKAAGGGEMHLNGGGHLVLSGDVVDLNGPEAACPASAKPASIIPSHEPWTRPKN